jgi:hypothetical protein
MPSIIKLNPDNFAPQEIVQNIIALEVPYVNFEGEQKVGVIEVHKDVVDDVHQFFVLSLVEKFPINKVVRSSDAPYLWRDDVLVADNTTSGFNYRFIRDTKRPSLHGLGLAFDVNTRLNPYIRFNEDGTESVDPKGAVYDPALSGVLTSEHPLVVFMKDHGWEWGGDWKKASGRTDYQHFQKVIS